MAYHISGASQDAAVNALTALFNQGAHPGVSTINIYSDTTSQPATPATALPGGYVLLASIPFASTAFTTSTGGAGSANIPATLSATASASGNAKWFRFYTGEATPTAIGDGTITATGGGGDMTFNTIAFVSGGTVQITTLTISVPM